MPCRISEEEELYYEMQNNKDRYGVKATDEEILTRVACDLSKAVKPLRVELKPLTLRWMKHHELLDQQREKRETEEKSKEKLRKKAISKLNEEEREALGL